MDSRKLNDMMLENEEEEEDQEMNSLAESEAEEPMDTELIFTDFQKYSDSIVNILLKLPHLPYHQLFEKISKNSLIREHNYIYIYALIAAISVEKPVKHHTTSYLLNKITTDLEAKLPADHKEKIKVVTDLLKFAQYKHAPSPEIIKSISNIQTTGFHDLPQSGDIVKIHKEYSSQTPPHVDFLRQPGLLDRLVRDVVTTSKHESIIKQEIWIIAYAVSVIEYWNDDNERVIDTKMLEKSITSISGTVELLKGLAPSSNFKAEFYNFMDFIDSPVCCIMITSWTAKMLEDLGSYDRYLDMGESPPLFDLLGEIAISKPFLRERVFHIFAANMRKDFDSLPPLQMMEIQKVFLDRILFLVRLGYVTPIFKYMVSHAGELSDSLKVHFVKEILSFSITTPLTVMKMMLDIVCTVKVTDLLREADVEKIFEDFLNVCEGCGDEGIVGVVTLFKEKIREEREEFRA